MRIVMMGTGTFAEPTFEALLSGPYPVVGLVTQPDKPKGQERGSTRQTGAGMKEIASARQIPVFQPPSINTPEGIAGLAALRPDLLVVAAYGQILSKEVLQVPSLGGINVHASLLPRYRGAAPVAWAIYHGDAVTGVTIIHMSPHLDAGGMLAQEELAILPHETAGELEARLASVGARLTLTVLDQIEKGTTQAIAQDRSLVTRAPKLTKEHGLIDWSRHARDICNQVRAMQPWPTAYTFWHRAGQPALRLLLYRTDWRMAPAPTSSAALPGTVLLQSEEPSRLWIAAGQGTQVEVLELQPAGKRRLSASEFLRGRRPQAGDHLGPEQS